MNLAEQLSERQHQVLCLVALGLTDKEIAKTLRIAPTSVYTHVINVRYALGAINRAHAVYLAGQYGILPDNLHVEDVQ